jgi:hypothetical protein
VTARFEDPDRTARAVSDAVLVRDRDCLAFAAQFDTHPTDNRGLTYVG